MEIIWIAGLLAAAYLIGAIPTAVWVGQRFYGVDVREHGSKNAGATNTFRVLGKKPGTFVLLFDVLKGWAATSLAAVLVHAQAIAPDDLVYYQLAMGILAVIGHVFPVYVGFKGGKGVATLLGMVLAIQPPAALICVGIFIVALLLFKYVSLGSMLGAVAFPLLLLLIPRFQPDKPILTVFGFLLATLVVYTHRKNIGRLRNGVESKVDISLFHKRS